MANNRLRLVGIDDDGNIQESFYIAKHCNGAWYTPDIDTDKLNEFFEKCYGANYYAIGITDEYTNKPLLKVYHYNDEESLAN